MFESKQTNNLPNVYLDVLMKNEVSYNSTENANHIIGFDKQPSAEECSNSCAEGLGVANGCKKFTWSIADDKKCSYFKDENLVEKSEYGSYSGVPRHRGNDVNISFIDSFLTFYIFVFFDNHFILDSYIYSC